MTFDNSTRADLLSSSRRRRKAGAHKLRDEPDAEAIPLLLALLEDEHEDVRSSALAALAESGDKRARDPAVEVLGRENEDEFVQREALFVLAAIADETAVAELRGVAETSASTMLRKEARLILANFDKANDEHDHRE